MTVWFTSDLHLYHENIIRFCNRPYKDIHHMTAELVKNYNSVVDHHDTVYFLGDICFGNREVTLLTLDLLNGVKVLVPGNHDHCHPMQMKNPEKFAYWCTTYSKYFDDILFDFPQIEGFRMSHFPYYSGIDYQGRDFSEWQALDDNTPLLCGHVHDEWQYNFTSNGTFMFNVGVDVNNFTPVSFDYIKNLKESNGYSSVL